MSDKPAPQPPASLDQMTMEEKLKHIEELKKMREALYAKAGEAAPPAPFTLASGTAPPWEQFYANKPDPNAKPQYPAPKLGYGYAGDNGLDDGEDYFDDDEEEGDYDDELEQFEQEIGAVGLGGSSSTSSAPSSSVAAFTSGFYAAGADTQVDVVTTDAKARRSYVGDFELLRLAKMGDTESFQFFAQQTQTDVKSFVDNKGRDSLFYATDSGSMALIQYLVEKVQMGLRRDERQLSPLDVAVLLGHSEIVAYLSEKFPLPVRSKEQLVAEFSPKPPKFCMSKPTSMTPCDTTRKRTFWSAMASPMTQVSSGSSSYAAEGFLPGSMPSMFRTVLECSNRPFTGEQRGLHAWTFPVEEEVLASVFPRAFIVGVTATAADGSVTAAGMGYVVPLQGSLVTQQGAVLAANVALASNYSILPQHQRKQVMSVALHKTKQLLTDATSTGAPWSDKDAVVFTSASRIPTAEPICVVKWFRRALKPQRIFEHLGAAGEVFSPFFEYDEQLRVDAVLKETIRTDEASSATIAQWQEADASNAEGAKLLRQQIPALLQKAGAELAFLPEDVAQSLCLNGIRTFVMFDAAGNLSDLVVVRLRNSRELVATAAAGQLPSFSVQSTVAALKACTVVLSAFTTIKADKRLPELMVIAGMLQSDVIYVTNTCGASESELSKSFFEESVTYREMLYAIRPTTMSAVVPKPVPAGKVYVPFSLL